MSTGVLPPVPYNTPMVDAHGLVTPLWAQWLKQLYIQTGASTAATLTDIETDITNINVDITQINYDATNLQNQVNGLGVGRQL